MIENFDPTPALQSAAPAVTAIVFTGDGVKPVDLDDLALCVDTGEVISLREKAILVAMDGSARTMNHTDDRPLADIAGLLRCEATMAMLKRVATLALQKASADVADRRAEAVAAGLVAAPTIRIDPRAGTLDAMLAEMDAAARLRPVYAK